MAVRITRVRHTPPRITRVRKKPVEVERRPAFVIDWGRSLSWKFSIYMVSSYMYYVLCRQVITDADYDRLCVDLFKGFDCFTHQHKYLVNKGLLATGSGYSIKEYPMMVRCSAHHMLDIFEEV